MKKGLVVVFPGGKGSELPILYFCAKKYVDNGWDKIFVTLPQGKMDFEEKYMRVKERLAKVVFTEYEEIIFIAKSIGTVHAFRIKEELQVEASLILFTPIEETIPYLKKNNNIMFVAAGDKDRHLESARLQRLCEAEKLPYYIESGVGHRMELKDDLLGSLKVIEHVLQCSVLKPFERNEEDGSEVL